MVQRCGASGNFTVNAVLFNCWSFVKVISRNLAERIEDYTKHSCKSVPFVY